VALVAALALLALGAALLAAAFANASAAARSARSSRAGIAAEWGVRAAMAERMAAWSDAENGLAIGGAVDVAFHDAGGAPPVSGSTRVLRLSLLRFVLVADVVVGDPAAPIARRRMRLHLVAPSADSTGARGPVRPIGRWSLGEVS
jgi:hypothetical protein